MTRLNLGLLIALAAVSPFFFIGGPSAASPLLFNHVWNLGHIVFFSGAALLAMQFIPLATWRAWLWLSASVFCLGIVIEFLQKFVGRDASWDDVFHNLCGVWFALFWGQSLNLKRWQALCLRMLSLALVIPSFWFTATTAYADFRMRNQFPIINGFEADFELRQVVNIRSQVTKQQANQYASQGRFSLAVAFGTDTYSGIKWLGPYGDWSQYRDFALDIYNPGQEAFEVTLKIADFQHDLGSNSLDDRFNRQITLVPGWNFLRVPIGEIRSAPASRAMQMDGISCLEIFTKRLDQPRLAYLDYLRLE